MITMIYEKTLTRKSFGNPEGDKPKENGDDVVVVVTGNGADSDQSPIQSPHGKGFMSHLRFQLKQIFGRKKSNAKKLPEEEKKQPASMGKILNLMR